MAEQEQLQLIVRHVPQLVKLLLDSEQEDETYKDMLQYAYNKIQRSCHLPHTKPSSVRLDLRKFIERYYIESLPVMGETIQSLTTVIIDDERIKEDLKWSLIDFFLSVNYCVFRFTRYHYTALIEEGKHALKQLGLSFENEQKAETKKDLSLPAVKRALETELGVKSKVINPKKESIRTSTHSRNDWIQAFECEQELPDKFHISRVLKNVQKMDRELERTEKTPAGNSYILYIYGKYLQSRLSKLEQGEDMYDEESFFLLETLQMFFAPCEGRHFVLVNNLIQLRTNELPAKYSEEDLISTVLKPLQHMQLLRSYMDCFSAADDKEKRLETLSSLTAALWRLLKPVIEMLTFYERNTYNEKWDTTLLTFQHATHKAFERLKQLWSLASALNTANSMQLTNPPYYGSLQILTTLLESTAEPNEQRPFAAAILLQVLQVYCYLLDNWWQTGSFKDSSKEFPFERVKLEDHTEYLLKAETKGSPLKRNAIFKIIEMHIKSAGVAIALLCDSKRYRDFLAQHRVMLMETLHVSLVKLVQQQLAKYKTFSDVKKSKRVPDIFQQLLTVNCYYLRLIYYRYYKQSLQEFKQSGYYEIHALFKCCQECGLYVELDMIICNTLRLCLERRSQLVNNYVMLLLKEDMKLNKILAHLRSVFLLLNFNSYAKEFDIVFGHLKYGLFLQASCMLQDIINYQNRDLKYLCQVRMPEANLAKISIRCSLNIELSSIITEGQLELYNKVFRTRLQLHHTVYRLQQLPQLNANLEVVQDMLQLKADLLIALKKHSDNSRWQKAAEDFDTNFPSCCTLVNLQELHETYVQALSSGLFDIEYELLNIFNLSRILAFNWKRVEHLMTIPTENETGLKQYNQRFEALTTSYLSSISNLIKMMHEFLSTTI